MANSSRGLFGRFFSNKKAAKPDSELIDQQAPVPDGDPVSGETTVAADHPLPPAAADQKQEDVQPLLFAEAGHIWDEYSDPLYQNPQEDRKIRECSSFIYNTEKKYAQELEAQKRAQNNPGQADSGAKGNSPDAPGTESGSGDPGSAVTADSADNAEELLPDRDAALVIYVSSDAMAAWGYVLPPSGAGKGLSPAQLQEALKQNNIRFGLIEDNFRLLLEQEIYQQPILIARGLPAKNGVNGFVTDHFKRQVTQQFTEDSRGNVNFKQLNNIQQVSAGDVICDITPAISGEAGKTVTGATISCQIPGKEAAVPQGSGTVLSDDRRQLLAKVDGHLQFKGTAFLIDPVLKITGDVDGSTGNLEFNGDISISGDVRNGFSVKASGNIIVRGSVEGACLDAGKDILISSGITGNGRAQITAGGSIQCKYLEHCTVTALGDIKTESIVLGQIQCNRNVIVTSGIGAIIGGKIVAASSIKARSIGSKSRHITTLVIGTPFKAVEDRRHAEQELKQIEHNLSELGKNITYLQSGRNPGKMHMLGQLIEAQEVISARKTEVEELLASLDADTCELKNCRIQCSHLFPVTDLQIGVATLRVTDEYSSCNIYYNDNNEIVIGTQ